MKRRWPERLHEYYDFLQNIKALNPFDNHTITKDIGCNPFFIVGSGRSGNTLLRRIMVQSPGIHIPPETYVLPSLIKLYRQNSHLLWRQLVNLMLANIEYYPEFDTFKLSSLRELAAKLYDIPEDQRSLALIIDEFFRFHAVKTGKQCDRWGDKTPLNTLFLDRISSVFPKAQYVNIVRDGIDVAYSYVDTGLYDELEAAGKRWKESIIKADKFISKNPSSVLTIHYEDLVSNPEPTVQQVCNFLQIQYHDSMLSVDQDRQDTMGDVEMRNHHYNIKKPITTSSIGKGRKNLSAGEKSKLNKLFGEELDKKGYTTTDL